MVVVVLIASNVDATSSLMHELMVLSLEECLEVLDCSVELEPLLVHRLRDTRDAGLREPRADSGHSVRGRSKELGNFFVRQVLTVARGIMARA